MDSLQPTFLKSPLKEWTGKDEHIAVLEVGTQRQAGWRKDEGGGKGMELFVSGFQLDLKWIGWLIV